MGDEVWKLGFEIQQTEYTVQVSFGLRSGDLLYGIEIMMHESLNKKFRMLVGPIKDGWIEGFGVKRGTNDGDKYPQHHYYAGLQSKYATMNKGISVFTDSTYSDKTKQFCSEIKDQTETKVQTFTGFCGRLDDGGFVVNSFV